MYLSRQKSFVATKVCLSRQKFCRDKTMFVATKLGDKHKHVVVAKYFGATNIILARQRFCRGKDTFVATKDVFVATKLLLRRK